MRAAAETSKRSRIRSGKISFPCKAPNQIKEHCHEHLFGQNRYKVARSPYTTHVFTNQNWRFCAKIVTDSQRVLRFLFI